MKCKLKCCGNCKNLENRYFGNKEIGQILHPRSNITWHLACNTLLCKKGHFPKFVDSVCEDDWESTEITIIKDKCLEILLICL